MITLSKSATTRTFLSGTVLLALVGVILPTQKVVAVLVTLEIAGTVNTFGGDVFGENGSNVPFLFSISYDTLLDTNMGFHANGVMLGSETTTHEWHGYSNSGITATNLTFGTNTWTVSNLIPRTTAGGLTADLWFDTDIALSVPTRLWMRFADPEGLLEFGPAVTGGGTVEMKSGVFIEHTDTLEMASTMSSTISAVPEAQAWLMMVFVTALAGRILGICRRSNKAFPR
jgi:hypothetical protein